MDTDRQIRFLIAPFFLYGSLAWWCYLDPSIVRFFSGLKPDDLKDVISIVAAAGAASIPIGYSIGTLGIAVLKLYFARKSKRSGTRQTYEASLSKDAFEAILRATQATKSDRKDLLYATATFDHHLLPEGIHTWLGRRWNSFNVAFNSALAVFLSLMVVPIRILYTRSLDPINGWNHRHWWWLITNLGLILLFGSAARIARHETMQMIEFQARRKNVYKFKEH